MSQLVCKECILFDIDAKHKEDVLLALIEKLKEQHKITSVDEFYKDVVEREKISPTAIGFNIGLPHGRTENVLESAICFGRLRQEIIWNEETKEKVNIIILIAVPSNDSEGTHMKILSGLARKLMHKEYRDLLISSNQDEVYDLLNQGLEE
ncbi:MAG: PTS sugar transporter subunit IIA [Coprobacillaceae bacterium]